MLIWEICSPTKIPYKVPVLSSSCKTVSWNVISGKFIRISQYSSNLCQNTAISYWLLAHDLSNVANTHTKWKQILKAGKEGGNVIHLVKGFSFLTCIVSKLRLGQRHCRQYQDSEESILFRKLVSALVLPKRWPWLGKSGGCMPIGRSSGPDPHSRRWRAQFPSFRSQPGHRNTNLRLDFFVSLPSVA